MNEHTTNLKKIEKELNNLNYYIYKKGIYGNYDHNPFELIIYYLCCPDCSFKNDLIDEIDYHTANSNYDYFKKVREVFQHSYSVIKNNYPDQFKKYYRDREQANLEIDKYYQNIFSCKEVKSEFAVIFFFLSLIEEYENIYKEYSIYNEIDILENNVFGSFIDNKFNWNFTLSQLAYVLFELKIDGDFNYLQANLSNYQLSKIAKEIFLFKRKEINEKSFENLINRAKDETINFDFDLENAKSVIGSIIAKHFNKKPTEK